MKSLFDQTKYTKWYITDGGFILSSTTYRSDGSVRQVASNRSKRGYLYARTTNGNYQIHRLVANAFIANPLNKPCVNHKDGNKHNNRVENLEWVTHRENMGHAIKKGLFKPPGKNSGNIKYTNSQCADVLRAIEMGATYKEAGAMHKMPYSTVAHLARGSRRSI